MRSQIDSAISAAREVGNAAAAALQKALDEHSPSRVTRKMGQFFGLGFSEGISDEESNTIKTTQQYADSAVNALKSGINNRISITRQSVVIIIFQDKQPTPLHNNSVTS